MTDQLPSADPSESPSTDILQHSQEDREEAVIRWLLRIRDTMRTSMKTHVAHVIPEGIEDSEVRRDVENTLYRCIDQLNRCIDRNPERTDRAG